MHNDIRNLLTTRFVILELWALIASVTTLEQGAELKLLNVRLRGMLSKVTKVLIC